MYLINNYRKYKFKYSLLKDPSETSSLEYIKQQNVLSYRHLKLYVWLESVLVSIFYVYLQWEFKINKVFAIQNSIFNCNRFIFKKFNYYNGSFVLYLTKYETKLCKSKEEESLS